MSEEQPLPAALPRVQIFCTGGTIAGQASSSTDLSNYNAGTLMGQRLLDGIPEAQTLAELEVEQVTNLNSADLGFEDWLELLCRIDAAFRDDPALAGVVVTHGTNTIDETAYFLNLTLPHDRPVVLVGAMRPATALSADGPLNLFQAIQVATSPEARGCGVVVLINEQIHGARAVSKVFTEGVAAFRSSGCGPLGRIECGEVRMSHRPRGQHTTSSWFRLGQAANPLGNTEPKAWPMVEILYGYVQSSATLIDALLSAGVGGLVFAGCGAGALSRFELAALDDGLARHPGLSPLMLRSSRTGSGRVPDLPMFTERGIHAADDLNPQKARILLLLMLLHGLDHEAIAEAVRLH